MKDENGNRLIGFIKVGGLAVPRAEVAKVLPDIERFERCLADAEMVNAYMTDHGKPPAVLSGWSDAYIDDIQVTMREVGAIEGQAAEHLRAERARRFPINDSETGDGR